MLKKSKLYLITIILITFFIVSCSGSEDVSESFTGVELPDDVPIYPGAVQVLGYQSGYLTTANYEIDSEYAIVQQWFDENLGSQWLIEQDWFEFGDSSQKYVKSSDLNLNPNARSGKMLILGVGKDDDNSDKTMLVIMYYDYED